ncbi:membrane dipeptidase [Hazenella sp. IB182353]|uniref:dipeptidase n=1 Tax=Polycladospora coralii TaxID=2771432 RepID=UPI00174704E4|nr:membrane dipeptidase [Polycladospora coralii]MBS7532011.1 membrane dipeptidase [Polycladospora coralii]
MNKDSEWFDFGLDKQAEERAKMLHENSTIIDLLFQGPLSPRAIPDEVSAELKQAYEPYRNDPHTYSSLPRKGLLDKALKGGLPQFKEEWYQSGITAGNRQLSLTNHESIIKSMAEVQVQFDTFDWLMKVKTAQDIRYAKENGLKAGIITSQESVGLQRDLTLLDALYDFGLRVLQLTYNRQDYVGAGCAEKSNAGLTNFGIDLIAHLNQRGILIDTSHCGKQTTLDACHYSNKPVIASHTGVENIYPHMRCKSDEEFKAIAETGGVIGVFAMPWFIHEEPNHTTIDHVLDHIDYLVKLVGEDHVGIGTDWPMSDLTWSLVYFKEHIAPLLGFASGDGPSTELVKGLEKYSSFINITRGLVKRGYGDEQIQKILGLNWLSVFEEVCG